MTQNLKLRGKALRLPASAVLGVGGEATVFDLGGNEVAKIWHAPTASQQRKVRALLSLTPALPPEVIAPTELVTDARGEVAGFVMPRVAADFVPFALLFKKSTAPDPRVALAALQHLRQVLVTLHARNIVVGDLSDQNVVVRGDEVRLLDVDSFQIDREPCPVATEATLDPDLYGIDLSRTPLFSPRTDAYAFAVLAFRALLLVHPYGGTYPRLLTVPERAMDRRPVFDKSVVYPQKLARPFTTLTDALQTCFEAIFKQGDRPLVPAQALAEMAAQLVTCADCGAFFPRPRGACPTCARRLPAPIVTRGLRAHLLLETKGEIVAGALQADGLTVVAREGETLVRRETVGLGRAPLSLGRGSAALVTPFGVVVSSLDDTLLVFADAGDGPPIATTTLPFDGAPMFAISGDRIVRLCGDLALSGQPFRQNLVERTMANALPGQTFLSPGPHPEGVLLGFTRVFRQIRFFRISSGKHLDLVPTSLEADEIFERATLFDDAGRTLLLRHTRLHGVERARLDLLDERGAVMLANGFRRDADPTRTTLEGRLVRGGVVLHPTDDGIVREELRHGLLGDCTTLPGTDAYVSARSLLLAHPRGVVVLEGNRATLLER